MKSKRRQAVFFTLLALPAIALAYVLYEAAFGTSKTVPYIDDLKHIRTALETFKSKYGAYPPDHQDELALASFQAKAFPRATDLEDLETALKSHHAKTIDGAEALVLYLNFLSSDPKNPYRYATQMARDPVQSAHPTWKELLKEDSNDMVSFFEFPPNGLVDRDGDGFPEFAQRQVKGEPPLELKSALRSAY